MAKKTIPDAVFINKFLEFKSKPADLAEHLGISRQAVEKRVKKLNDIIELQKGSGQEAAVAAMVARAIPPAQKQREQFVSELEDVGKQYHIFDHLEDLYRDVRALLTKVKAEIAAKDPEDPLQQNHLDAMVKLVQQARGLITDAHKIKLELVQAQHMEVFIQSAMTILLRYDVGIREKLYDELFARGVAGQMAIGMVSQRSDTGGKTGHRAKA